MPKIGEVEYDEAGFEHMRQLHALMQTATPKRAREILAEAETMNEFYRQFPGMKMHDVPAGVSSDDIVADLEAQRRAGTTSSSTPSKRAGRFYGHDATETERASGEQKELEDEGPLRPDTLAHKVLNVYGDGQRRTAYDASMELTGDGHAKRRESRRLHDRGYLRKHGTLPNRSPDGRDHVDAYEITPAGRAELVRLGEPA